MIRIILLSATLVITNINCIAQEGQYSDSISEKFKQLALRDKVKELNRLCWLLRNSAPEVARGYGLEAIEYAKEIDSDKDLIKAYSFTGVACRNMGYFDEALKYYSLGYDEALKSDDIEEQGFCYVNFGNLYLYLNQPSRAKEFLDKAKPLAESINNKTLLGYIYLNSGRVKLSLRRFEEAIIDFQKSYQIREKLNNLNSQSVCYKYMGDAYLGLGQDQQALASYQKAQRIFNLANDKHLLGHLLLNVSKAHHNLGNTSDGKEALDESLQIARQINSWFLLQAAYQNLSDWELKNEDFENALAHLQISKIYQDSINNDNLQNQLVSFNYSMQKKELEYEQRLSIMKERQGRTILIVVLILMSIITLLGIRNNYLVKKSNLKLSAQNDKIKKLSKLKKDFTSMIAHDLKNPINSILGMTSVPYNVSANAFIRQACEDMMGLITNMLEVHRMEDQQIELKMESINLHYVVQHVIDQMGFLISQNGHKIQNLIPKEIYILSDFKYFPRIIENLLSNATKYTPSSGNIKLDADIRGDFVCIRVKDDGLGIPKSKQNKIFEKFWKNDEVSESGSTGLGLTFCKMAVEAHGGEIGLESTTDKGSIFWFTVKLGDPNLEITNPHLTQLKKIENVENLLHKMTPSSEEFEILNKIAQELKNVSIYKVSKIMKVLEDIPNEYDLIIQWKKYLEKAYRSGDDSLYKKLVNTYLHDN